MHQDAMLQLPDVIMTIAWAADRLVGGLLRMVKCTPMRRDLQWFRNHIGLTVTRNGRDFTIVNERYADYAWSLQDNGFEYA